jgi:hypothetical protein
MELQAYGWKSVMTFSTEKDVGKQDIVEAFTAVQGIFFRRQWP